ncbi:tRNA (guanosine(37)-N1)-methyltransferase TrmD [Candidatus Berkelbacteria bacterium CG_4_9_14_0_2_um_filter_42_30]|uniref:tRNA (guanine-N(1)-)-methyltransferase n=5 Tax=Candidatus Berkelbacteria TaxID=1618330 RepID=A0A2M7K1A0_9BACT|nr:MAG: tRNA (guanosine(37)-N1)-methyltransferase TrmD [Candidatus Berkelbacteria bacterium CG1_02_42_45]PIR27283.1 MAG: tRNA (guanosine(37)-N1)-methyltransferase TrmD [Candidatus Berkelbacteria bacterium CG11_big_fil_rev_8_21_14_0_20_42_15]PIX30029.1 MAG: tRNA (guanosine(37)-N1)-methyltransferase TrmD [Candidatus Berkelbacteria bacterium CG_4_8_14_3_um_filter_42_13]PIZ27413.1 MAG: tRNA (guanosine(37)-N1)-methyltransferase TrmD [Candidatus Berkelbacteria bacterium CG_4_10_14_0_8_um_filter_42_34]
MEFNIITLFPEMFGACPSKLEERSGGPLSESILKRAQEKDLIKIVLHQLRDYAEGKHKTVDDTPYGGGKGMVIKVDVVDKAISKITRLAKAKPRRKDQRSKFRNKRTILLSPRGRRFNQDIAKELTKYDNLILICGHYEGFDERVRDLVDEEISIGDFVLTGGEIPAMAIVDAVSRLIPGVLADESPENESFMQKDEAGNYLLEYPQYTRPLEYKGKKVPEILLSGNHAEIEKWRQLHRRKTQN